MNPNTVALARTARLAARANARVLYTSETGVPTQRERMQAGQEARVAANPGWSEHECRCGDC